MINPFELSVVSSDAFREIFQSMTEGIIVVNKEGIILTANSVAEVMFGYDNHALGGKTLESLLPERYRGRHLQFRDEFNHKPFPRRMGIGRDLSALKKNGSEFPVEISLSYSKAGGNFIVIAFITDITLRKNSEVALRQSEEQLILYASELEKKVHLRTEALNNSIEELEKEVVVRKKAEDDAKIALEKERELNELKSKFVSLASHEFRTPLSTIMSSASLISQYKDRSELEKVEKHVQRIKSSVGHLITILNDFLSLGKLEEGKVEIMDETIELKGFFSEIEEELKATLKSGQQIKVGFDPNLDTIESDSSILRNILFNLISNASKYSPDDRSIYVNCTLGNDKINFSVRDEGIGIPENEFKHIFERFYRASNAGQIQGTGLGLNIVKRYAELLGGKISFTSQYGTGSTFTISIPSHPKAK